MRLIALNGSPRKNWNTATLLEKVLEGASAQGAQTELIHLYDLEFKGCRSCFACKTKGGASYGRCAAKDGLTTILERIEKADALVLGSPIYFGAVSGEMRSFIERLVFPYWTYTDPPRSLFPKKIPTGFIYTMNVTEEELKNRGYHLHAELHERILKTIFGASESLFCFDTYQFADYSKVSAERFDAGKKAKRRREVFPLDCERAFDMGQRMMQRLL